MSRIRTSSAPASLPLLLALMGILALLINQPVLAGKAKRKLKPNAANATERGDLLGKPDTVPVYDARTLWDTVSVRGASFSADETRLLITTDQTGVFNIYSQPVAGGAPAQLTFSTDDACFGIGWFPMDDRFLYRSNEGGNELNHLFVMTPGGEPRDLTPGEGHRAGFTGWAGDFSAFYVQTNERDQRSMDLYRYDIDTYERTLVFTNTGGYSIAGLSRDGRWLTLSRVRNNADDDLYLWDVTNPESEPVHVTPHEGNISHRPMGFSIDSSRMYYLSNEASEFNRLWAFDIESRDRSLVDQADWDIMYSYYSWNGRYRVRGVNEDARTAISIIDTATDTPLTLPRLPRGDITGLSIARSEKIMAFYVNGDTSPSNLYVLDLETKQHRRLTSSLSAKIDPEHLVESQVVRYSSFDGLQIPALLYRPHNASPSRPAPALVWVHGGPGGQSRTGYNPFIQYLVNHGYAILSVNNRGSSGYGKTFFHLDDQRHGEDDLQDVIYGRKMLESLAWVDADRIGIIGGSYGGYMTAAALAFEPEAFDVGIDIFGVTNWLRTLTSIPPWWEDFKESLYAEMGNPETDEARLRRISPLFHAENIVKPMLVVQGANDPRVLKAESDEIVAAVEKNGVPIEYLVFEDEGHGFMNKDNRIESAERIGSFLDKYLRGGK